MDTLNELIAENLKKIREAKKLSLDNVAKLSGVSKSMLDQIERGEANLTLSSIWKIANGLKISFTQFVSIADADIEVVDMFDMNPLLEDEGRVIIYPVFPFDNSRRFEVYSLTIKPGGCLSIKPHLPGTEEFIRVHSGKLILCLENKEFIIDKDNSIRFKSDIFQLYKNIYHETCALSMLIHYPT